NGCATNSASRARARACPQAAVRKKWSEDHRASMQAPVQQQGSRLAAGAPRVLPFVPQNEVVHGRWGWGRAAWTTTVLSDRDDTSCPASCPYI
ncbi:hypothetical protein GBAR_LOCUS11250, partial [Geodia barretti]